MFLNSLTVNEDVVNVHHHKIAKKGSEHVIHGCLTGFWSVGKPKAKDFELIMPKRRTKSCFTYIFWCDADLVVACLKVKNCKDLSTSQRIHQMINTC
jgi:hypothetical protein